jgi:glucose-6-phosphate isomerase
MIIFPYKDKLELLVAYAQQLIMESLGKEYDLDGKRVCQGLTVYGGRGNTAQHSFMQQLFVGGGNFFVVFLEVLRGRDKLSPLLSGGNISGDYLEASLLGARQVFSQKGISSITITLPDLNPYTIGLLIALWERTVSIYAYMINVNAYNQPAVEICKTEALKIMALKNRLCLFFKENPRMFFTAEEIAVILNEDAETIFKCLQYLRANEDYGVKAAAGSDIFSRLYSYDV